MIYETSGPMFDLMVALKDTIDDAVGDEGMPAGDALNAIGNVVAYIIKDADSEALIHRCLAFLVEVALTRIAHDRSMHVGTGAIN